MDRRRRIRPFLTAVSAVTCLSGASPPAPTDVVAMAGAWDVALEGSHRKCRITLGLEPASLGRGLRFPAGCRRALPVLRTASAWLVPERGLIRLIDAAGDAVLEFRPDGPDRFLGRTAAGETYRLERQEDLRMVSLPPAPVPIGVPQVTPIDPAKAPPFAAVPGRYVVDRYTEKDVCRLALTPTMTRMAGRYEAQLLEGCRDQGLRIFDPVAWRYEGGRLTLTSRRGHEVTLISEREGQWRRDPEVGATLILRKATP